MAEKIYTCPMHPEVRSNKPGRCPKCGMELISTKNQILPRSGTYSANSKQIQNSNSQNYKPLFVVIGLILIASLAVSYPQSNVRTIIGSFMTGFFLVFSGFKLIDLKGFAQGYSTYDLLEKHWFNYGFVYPFIELSFGLLMILGLFTHQVLIAEVIVMGFSGIGVAIKLLKHEKFQCVCLGAFLKVPLTYVTLIEDFGMAGLAAILLIVRG